MESSSLGVLGLRRKDSITSKNQTSRSSSAATASSWASTSTVVHSNTATRGVAAPSTVAQCPAPLPPSGKLEGRRDYNFGLKNGESNRHIKNHHGRAHACEHIAAQDHDVSSALSSDPSHCHIPTHSACTLRTCNAGHNDPSEEPPECLPPLGQTRADQSQTNEGGKQWRSVFGRGVDKKYRIQRPHSSVKQHQKEEEERRKFQLRHGWDDINEEHQWEQQQDGECQQLLLLPNIDHDGINNASVVVVPQQCQQQRGQQRRVLSHDSLLGRNSSSVATTETTTVSSLEGYDSNAALNGLNVMERDNEGQEEGVHAERMPSPFVLLPIHDGDGSDTRREQRDTSFSSAHSSSEGTATIHHDNLEHYDDDGSLNVEEDKEENAWQEPVPFQNERNLSELSSCSTPPPIPSHPNLTTTDANSCNNDGGGGCATAKRCNLFRYGTPPNVPPSRPTSSREALPLPPVSPLTPGDPIDHMKRHYGSTDHHNDRVHLSMNGHGDNHDIVMNGDFNNATIKEEEEEEEKAIMPHETLHAQSLILALAFLAIWSPSNLMAPNLTQMANYFHFNPNQRDLYLGANIAFATGVLSLPVSALIGFFADVVPSRKCLYAFTVLVGGISSICTGLSETYSELYFARFVNGGCMAGSVPVAFSLLGDLFDTKDRNAASSGLTAMMGTGIIVGQVYAGAVGDTMGWKHPFYLSGVWTVLTALLVLKFVNEPIRGGKEKVLQDMIAKGTRYERKLTLHGFVHAMRHNASNVILMWQGFFSSVPWGIIFVFLNDYLSQERGLSVPDATFLVFMFGIGCAVGGVLGGYLGQITTQMNRSYLPLFMAVTTFLGIAPFMGLLNGNFHSANVVSSFYALSGGCIASLPSVNVRPCLINVNPPETRGAALTAANLIINLARGTGPSFVTMMGAIWDVDRKFSFNVTLIIFWTITAIQLLFLARSLPRDQDAMEAELAQYAALALICTDGGTGQGGAIPITDDETLAGDESIVSIEDRMTSFDAGAIRESLEFFGDSFKEIGEEWRHLRHHSRNEYEAIPENGPTRRRNSGGNGDSRRALWRSQQTEHDSLQSGSRYRGCSSPSPRNGPNDQVVDKQKGTKNAGSGSYDDDDDDDDDTIGRDSRRHRGPVIDTERGKFCNSSSTTCETLL